MFFFPTYRKKGDRSKIDLVKSTRRESGLRESDDVERVEKINVEEEMAGALGGEQPA